MYIYIACIATLYYMCSQVSILIRLAHVTKLTQTGLVSPSLFYYSELTISSYITDSISRDGPDCPYM